MSLHEYCNPDAVLCTLEASDKQDNRQPIYSGELRSALDLKLAPMMPFWLQGRFLWIPAFAGKTMAFLAANGS